MMGIELDDALRLARAGEYWRIAINDDDRFRFGDAHTRTKYAIVQRDVLTTEHMVPCWICTLFDPDASDWFVDNGLNVPAVVDRFEQAPCSVAIDIMKPISFPAAWFAAASGRAEVLGTITAESARTCLAQQAVMMSHVSLGLRGNT